MTTRGRRLLLLAAGLYLVAWGFGTAVMFPVAIGLSVAPLVALVWVKALDRPMRLRRRTGHLELTEGQSVDVGLEVRPDTGGPIPGRAIMLDRLGTRVIEAELARRGRVLRGRYEIAAAPRGRYRMDGAELLIADPFGLAEARIKMDRADQMLVYPRVYELEGLFTDGGTPGGDRGRSMLHRASGYDLHSIREHQVGESLRRVHWRSTARRGELMVRRDEQPRQMRATVLLDTRTTGHRGDGPASSFEWAVSAAASVAVHLAGQRYGLRLLTDESPAGWSTASAVEGAGTVLDELAVVRLGGPRRLSDSVTTLTRTGGDGMVVVVLGEAAQDEVEALATLGRHGARGVAILLRTPEWSTGVPERTLESLQQTREHNAEALRAAGWSVVEAGAADTVPEVWARATGTGQTVRPRMVVLPQGGSR
jgi:uncharacterized protein (DUF58 family)